MRLFAVAVLAPLLATCSASIGGPAAVSQAATLSPPDAVIPFDMSTGRPIVQAMVNGQGPYPFIFDTGSPILLVMSQVAEDLDLDVVGQMEIGTPSSQEQVPADIVAVDSVTIGQTSLSSVEATVLALEGLPPEMGLGIIGPDMFRDRGRVTMDFETNTILIGGDIDEANISTWSPIAPSRHLNTAMRVGSLEIPVHIDTGNPGVLSIPVEYEDQLPLTGPARAGGTARVVGGQFEIRRGPIDTPAHIGDATVSLTEVLLLPVHMANFGSAGLNGLRLDIDLVNDRFALTQPSSADQGQPQERVVRRVIGGASAGGPTIVRRGPPADSGPRFGLNAEPPGSDGTMLVHGAEPGSPADAIGLLSRDRIVAINGTPPGELGIAGIRAAFGAESLVLTVDRNGEEITLAR